MAKTVDKPISLSAYARHRGVSRQLVTAAIKDGRLMASLDHSGSRVRIRSAELADREWELAGVSSAPQKRKGSESPVDALAAAGIPTLAVSRARLHAAKASIATMELLEKKGKLIPVERVRAEVSDRFTAVRTRLLALPTEARQRIPELTDDSVAVLDALVREALEHLAGEIS